MNPILRSLFVMSYATVLSGGWCLGDETKSPKPPSIAEIVFMGLRPAKDLDPSLYPTDRRLCLEKYLATIAPDSYLWTFKSPSALERVIPVRKVVMKEQMVAILGQQVRAEAEAFANAIPLMIEWEGMSEGPVSEADFADNWLKKRSKTPIAPFIYLFKAHRLRAGYEAARARHQNNLWPILARRYRESLNIAKSSSNPLISCIADDLDAQPFIYLEGQGVP
ncbi:MAG: hypothetical protein AB1547_15805 [Thermodesulfobacteriota bacterium]